MSRNPCVVNDVVAVRVFGWAEVAAVNLDLFPATASPNAIIDRRMPYIAIAALRCRVRRPEAGDPHAAITVINAAVHPAVAVAIIASVGQAAIVAAVGDMPAGG